MTYKSRARITNFALCLYGRSRSLMPARRMFAHPSQCMPQFEFDRDLKLSLSFSLPTFSYHLDPVPKAIAGIWDRCTNDSQIRDTWVVMLEPTSFPSLSFRFPNGMLTLQRVATRWTRCVCSKKQRRVYRQLGLGIVNVEHVVHAMHGEYKRRAWSLTMIIPQPNFRLAAMVLTTLKIDQ